MRPFSASLPMALLRAREAVMDDFRRLLARHGLTEQQWRVVRLLADSDEPVAMGEIAARTFLLAPSLTRIVANLSDRGLVERRAVPADQRRATIELTADGEALAQSIAPQSEVIYATIEAAFGQRRLDDLMHELDALDAALRERDTSDDAPGATP